MTEKVHNLLNEQIQKEIYSAYLYLEMSNFYKEKGLDGFASWFYIQMQEELSHAMLIRTYLQDNDCALTLLPIDAPDKKFIELDSPIKAAFEHEKYVTASINNIVSQANSEDDYRSLEFLNWFVTEQAEEESNFISLIKRFNLFGSDPRGLYMLDGELGARVFTPPAMA